MISWTVSDCPLKLKNMVIIELGIQEIRMTKTYFVKVAVTENLRRIQNTECM